MSSKHFTQDETRRVTRTNLYIRTLKPTHIHTHIPHSTLHTSMQICACHILTCAFYEHHAYIQLYHIKDYHITRKPVRKH